MTDRFQLFQSAPAALIIFRGPAVWLFRWLEVKKKKKEKISLTALPWPTSMFGGGGPSPHLTTTGKLLLERPLPRCAGSAVVTNFPSGGPGFT